MDMDTESLITDKILENDRIIRDRTGLCKFTHDILNNDFWHMDNQAHARTHTQLEAMLALEDDDERMLCRCLDIVSAS